MEDSWYMNYLMYNEFVGNPRGVLNKYRFYRIRHHDKRPWRGAQAFRNVIKIHFISVYSKLDL